MSVKHNLEQWIAQLDYDDTCDISDRQVSDLIRNYAALEARCAALAAENAGLKSAIEKHADSYIMCGYCRTERDGKNDDVCEVLDSIPATDAFLAEMRAQGVEMFAKAQEKIADEELIGANFDLSLRFRGMSNAAKKFAAQLRQEAAQ